MEKKDEFYNLLKDELELFGRLKYKGESFELLKKNLKFIKRLKKLEGKKNNNKFYDLSMNILKSFCKANFNEELNSEEFNNLLDKYLKSFEELELDTLKVDKLKACKKKIYNLLKDELDSCERFEKSYRIKYITERPIVYWECKNNVEYEKLNKNLRKYLKSKDINNILKTYKEIYKQITERKDIFSKFYLSLFEEKFKLIEQYYNNNGLNGIGNDTYENFKMEIRFLNLVKSDGIAGCLHHAYKYDTGNKAFFNPVIKNVELFFEEGLGLIQEGKDSAIMVALLAVQLCGLYENQLGKTYNTIHKFNFSVRKNIIDNLRYNMTMDDDFVNGIRKNNYFKIDNKKHEIYICDNVNENNIKNTKFELVKDNETFINKIKKIQKICKKKVKYKKNVEGI